MNFKKIKEEQSKNAKVLNRDEKLFSISDMEDMFFAGYFHHPTGDLDDGKQDVLNESFLNVMKNGEYFKNKQH